MRLFVAIDVSGELREQMGKLQTQLRPVTQRVKWVAPRNLHLPLKFLGDTPAGRLEAISAELDSCAAEATPFDLEVEGLGAFPNLRSPRIVWVGLSEASELSHLAQQVDRRMETLGFAAEARPFRAHLTLGRAREALPDPALQQALEGLRKARFGRIAARELVLYSSTLGGSEPVYKPLSQHPLGPGKANAATTL